MKLGGRLCRALGIASIVVRLLADPAAGLAQTAGSPQAGPTSSSTATDGRDPLLNGVLIGAGVGFAGGFLGLTAFNAKETASGPIWDREALGYYTAAGVLGAAVGAGAGALIDALRRSPRKSSPTTRPRLDVSPTLGRHTRGAMVSFRY